MNNKNVITLLLMMVNSNLMYTQAEPVVAERISKSAEIILNDDINNVFPLFGPIREMDWEYGWNPEVVYSTGALVEKGMIFRSPARFEGEQPYLWVITQFRPSEYLIEYTVSASDRIWFIKVLCESIGTQTEATITYTFTALNEHGASLNKIALEKMYSRNLEDWQESINYYLKTGTALGSPQHKTN